MNQSRDLLVETLADLGVRGLPRVLSSAPPDPALMAETYERVNSDLDRMVAKQVLGIDHVTGEASALVDPAQRRVLRKAAVAGARTRLACHFSGQPRADRFLAHWTRHWMQDVYRRPLAWTDVVDMLSLAASGKLQVWQLPKPESVHFSVFGDRLLLLQSKHEHPSVTKWVWYAESADVVRQLRSRADRVFERCAQVPQWSFGQILDWMSDIETVTAVRGLGALTARPDDTSKEQGNEIPGIDRFVGAGLVMVDGGVPRLSPAGQAWLGAITSS